MRCIATVRKYSILWDKLADTAKLHSSLGETPRRLKIAETKDQTKNNKNNALADAEAAAEPAISEFDEARPQSLSRICCLFAAGDEGPMLGDTVGPRRESSKSITTT